jgi:hypothetical protein
MNQRVPYNVGNFLTSERTTVVAFQNGIHSIELLTYLAEWLVGWLVGWFVCLLNTHFGIRSLVKNCQTSCAG